MRASRSSAHPSCSTQASLLLQMSSLPFAHWYSGDRRCPGSNVSIISFWGRERGGGSGKVGAKGRGKNNGTGCFFFQSPLESRPIRTLRSLVVYEHTAGHGYRVAKGANSLGLPA